MNEKRKRMSESGKNKNNGMVMSFIVMYVMCVVCMYINIVKKLKEVLATLEYKSQ